MDTVDRLNELLEAERAGVETLSRLLPEARTPEMLRLFERVRSDEDHGRVEAKYLRAYLDEFAFRFNGRKSRHVGMIFFRLAQQGVQTAPLPYRALVRPVRKHKQ
ncbi:MAG: hypothetical protein HY725_19540 [Candidatus Rokubacteria bacterium]|nr:hypothetical protein [Candidatus Rokubacteria bacterium]